MNIKNLILAFSILCFATISVLAQTAGIPLSEYNTLIELYENSVGPDWIANSNWLDTTTHSVADWYGVTVENEHVTKIELPNNNLQEGIFENPVQLIKLEVLVLNGNKLMDANFNNLEELSKLTAVHIENNNFIFKHIKDIQNLPFFSNFSANFSFSPQAKVDISEEITIAKDDLLEMSVNPFYLSLNDKFQWFKDGVTLTGKTDFTYFKINALIGDSGTYYLQITNPDVPGLTLQSFNKKVIVTDLVGGVPRKEYEALVEIYNSTDGNNWNNTTNWLDTAVVIDDWYGITVENEHVTSIELGNNNLQNQIPKELGQMVNLKNLNLSYNDLIGAIPKEFRYLIKLESLNLMANELGAIFENGIADPERQIPDELAELASLTYLNLNNNKLMFNDIEPIFSWNNFNNINQFIYKLQGGVGISKNETLEIGNNLIITINNYLPGNADTYEWYKNGILISGKNSTSLELTNIQISDEGFYQCIIKNSVVPDLLIYTGGFDLYVDGVHGAGIPLSEYLALEYFYNSTNGDNWANNDNWLDTTTMSVDKWYGITVVESHVINIYLDSNNVSGPIPESIENLTQLKGLGLANNNLNGEIPGSIGDLTNLRDLVLWDNNLSGNIPSSIGNLKDLIYLELQHNSLSGTIPASLGNLVNLKYITLNNNKLVGPLPVELKNLTKIGRLNIENNLIGEIQYNLSSSLTKSNKIDNRQIPDELEDLIEMDTLYLGGNKLQFNDIEAIFTWDNFNKIKDFIYYPQNFIGIAKTENAFTGNNITLSIDNYFPGPSDKYQWYKNNSAISGAKNATLYLSNIKLTDAGKYYCKITNPVASKLTLTSKSITVEVSESIAGAGIPISEYLALVEIYESSNGSAWTNNEYWLDTISHPVNDWFGITVENGHVTKFEIPENNLSKIPEGLKDLPELSVIDLSEGNFCGTIPNLGSLSKLTTLSLAYNNFTFKNLTTITLWENYNNFKTGFDYIPQQEVGKADTLECIMGDTIILDIKNYQNDENDNFNWFKNGISLQNSQVKTYTKTAWLDDNLANFHCEITNSLLPGLIFTSDFIYTKVFYNSVDSLLLAQLKQQYESLKEIWQGDSIFNWQGVTIENGNITSLDLSGLNIEGDISSYFTDFDSLKWLNLSNNRFSGQLSSLFGNESLQKSMLTESSTLNYLNIARNRFTFADLEEYATELNSIEEFIYSPQATIGNKTDTSIYKYESITFKIPNYIPANNDIFSWQKNGATLENTNQAEFIIQDAVLADNGFYTLSISNSQFPELTLSSDTIFLKVLIPAKNSDIALSEINIYPNPAYDKIFVNLKNLQTDFKIFNYAGIQVFEEKDIETGWFDIQKYTPGVYIFRFENEQFGTINKKVVIE